MNCTVLMLVDFRCFCTCCLREKLFRILDMCPDILLQ